MNNHQIDFSTVLAASMHDMKNSLCMLLQSLDTLSEKVEQTPKAREEFAQLHYEIARVNSNLLQLLAMYRQCNDSLPLHIEEVFIDDLIDELISKNDLYISNNQIDVSVEIEADLAWYLDKDLILNLLNDIFINALKYTHSKINISVSVIDEQRLSIQMQDDGAGYPKAMIDKSLETMSPAMLTKGRTGLGIYFANLIAHAHTNGEHTGYIKLENGGQFGGSVFTLSLP